MTVIGLTGPTGSGKGAVGELLQLRGIPVLDTDQTYHSIVSGESECVGELASRFGGEVRTENGALDRKKLASIVFCGGEEQVIRCRDLNAITHKYVLREVRVWLACCRARGASVAVVDAPMLFESGFHRECTAVLSVVAEADVRLARICERDGISQERALERIRAQKDVSFYKENSDYVIENSGTLGELEARVEDFLADLERRG